MSMEYIGPAQGNGKAVFLISVRTVEVLAGSFSFPAIESHSVLTRLSPTSARSHPELAC